MENSILKSIKQWSEENNCPFSCIIYKIDKNFPKVFHDVVINYIKSTHPGYEEKDILDEFAIIFTPNHSVYLEFLNDKNRVIIMDEDEHYDTLPPATVVRERKFLSDLKQLDDSRLNQILKTIPEEYSSRFTQTKNLEDITKKIIKNIIDYIEYCVEERKKHVEKIFFIESDSVKNSTQANHKPSYNQQRKNPEISFDERKSILDSYESEYEFEAEASNTKSVYTVKVYKVQNIKYKIIMEPKEGTKYTKVVHLDKEKLSLGETKQIVIDSLQLDRKQISQSNNITRHSHTNIDEYKKLLEYLVTKNDTGVNYGTRKKIEEAENTKKR